MESRRGRLAIRLFAGVQRLLPAGYRDRHGDEALWMFRRLVMQSATRRAVARVTYLAVVDALRRLPAAHVAAMRSAAAGSPGVRRHPMDVAMEVRRAARGLLRQPVFTGVVVSTLALAMGATTSIVTIADAVLFRALPYGEADGLYRLVTYYSGVRNGVYLSWPDYSDVRAQSTTLGESGIYDEWTPSLAGGGDPEYVDGLRVSSGFARVLGLVPTLGRFFDAAEDESGHDAVVVLSWGLWQRRYGGDRGILGRTIEVNGAPHTVIGIGPSDLPTTLPAIGRAEIFRPFGFVGAPEGAAPGRGNESFGAVVRLRPGITAAQADAELEALTAVIERAFPGTNTGQRLRTEALREDAIAKARPALMVFLAAVSVVLLIAVTNVVNLMLVRASARRRELAMRAALGAGRRGLSLLVIAEALILAVAGGLSGLVLASGATRMVLRLAGSTLPLSTQVALDGRVLLVTGLICVATGIITGGVTGFLSTRTDLNRVLMESGTRGTVGRSSARVRRGLVVCQVALCVVLVIAAGLLARSLGRLIHVDPGFDTNVVGFRVSVPRASYPDNARVNAYYSMLLDRVRGVPGVVATASVGAPPLSTTSICGTLWAEEDPHRFDGQDMCAEVRPVSPDYFEVMRIQLVAGRTFTAADDSLGPEVGIVSERTAKLLWGDADPIGRRFGTGLGITHEVVGVVRDVKQFSLDENTPPQTYLPTLQWSVPTQWIVARVDVPPETTYGALRQAVWSVDDRIPVRSIGPLDDNVRRTLVAPRFRTALLVAVSLLALCLAVIGLYGVVAASVAGRRGEMAIRLSLGAQPVRVLRMVLVEGGRLVLAGLIIGLGSAWMLSRLLTGLLFDVAATDPMTFATASLAVVAAALFAMMLPAIRATRVDPADALRQQ